MFECCTLYPLWVHKEARAISVAKEVVPSLNIFDEAVIESDVVVWSWNRSVCVDLLLRKVWPGAKSDNSSHFVQDVLATHGANSF